MNISFLEAVQIFGVRKSAIKLERRLREEGSPKVNFCYIVQSYSEKDTGSNLHEAKSNFEYETIDDFKEINFS